MKGAVYVEQGATLQHSISLSLVVCCIPILLLQQK